ncbi:MAG: hypothetical protein Q9186_002636 [Xanthomendoza sp. 1 TL-2023]
MKERTASVPLAQAGAAPNMQRTTEMVHIPHANLPYPPPAALSQPTRNDGIFLNTTLHTIHQARYSPERNHISAAPTASAGRRPSSNNAGHDERHDKSGPSSRRSSRQQHHHISSTNHSPYDPEKATHPRHSPTHAHRPAHIQSTYIAEEEEEERNEHTVWILVYLSFFSPAVAALASIYTLLATLLLLLCSPITVFLRPRKSLKSQFHAFLAPPIHYQLRLVFPSYEPDFDIFKADQEPESNHSNNNSNNNNPFLLTFVNIFSPVYAAGIAVTAWVAAGFWFTALILGDPDGRDKKDDGRTVVLGVRRLWERWLLRGLR